MTRFLDEFQLSLKFEASWNSTQRIQVLRSNIIQYSAISSELLMLAGNESSSFGSGTHAP